MKNKIFIIILLFLSQNIFAQSIYWQKYYRGINQYESNGFDITVTKDSNYFIVGTEMAYNYSGIVIKINKFGEILNQINIDSFSTLTCSPSYENGCIVMGEHRFTENNMYSANINSFGNLDWIKNYDYTHASVCFEILRTANNNYIACGIVEYLTGYIIKLDSLGNRVWQKFHLAGFAKDYFHIIEGNNYYLLSGIRQETPEDAKGIITRIDTSGNIKWERDYFYNNNSLSNIIVRKLNNNLFLVAASVGDQIIERKKSIFYKIDSSGNVMNSFIELPKFDNYSAFMQDCKIINENKFIFLIDNENSYSAKSSVYITDSLGTILKANIFNYTDYILLKKAYKLNDGFIFIGNSNNYLSYRENIYVIKTDTNLYAPNPVSINPNEIELNEELISIEPFPNPFNNFINFKINIRKEGNYDLLIYDCLGRLIINQKNIYLHQGKTRRYFDFTDFPSGIYFVKINNENYNKIQKIIHIK
jgi:hypothetical protein